MIVVSKTVYTEDTNSCIWCKKNSWLVINGGPGIGNPPANAEDMGSIPGLERSHMLWGTQACTPQLLSLCSRACGKLQLLKGKFNVIFEPH